MRQPNVDWEDEKKDDQDDQAIKEDADNVAPMIDEGNEVKGLGRDPE
jgi:hypothetical protein